MSKHRLHRFQTQITQIVLLATCYLLLATLLGCEAFVRKFTRSPKKPISIEEPVLVPQEYPEPILSAYDMYKDYYLFFRMWMDELIQHLEPSGNFKKMRECIKEAKENLLKMHSILKEEKQKELESYIQKLEGIENQLRGFLSQDRFYSLRNKSISLKTEISRGFSYSKIKSFIKE